MINMLDLLSKRQSYKAVIVVRMMIEKYHITQDFAVRIFRFPRSNTESLGTSQHKTSKNNTNFTSIDINSLTIFDYE